MKSVREKLNVFSEDVIGIPDRTPMPEKAVMLGH